MRLGGILGGSMRLGGWLMMFGSFRIHDDGSVIDFQINKNII